MATVKTCFRCLLPKPLEAFYRHPHMADGHLNKCIECAKADVRSHRRTHDSVREYDRQRGKLPHRIALSTRSTKAWRKADPRRNTAHMKLQRAVKAGIVATLPCWVCGAERVEGHHPDYDAPLDVVWLCTLHHRRLHVEFVKEKA